MKKLFSILFSNKLTLFALLAFGSAMAAATFLENDFGTPAARNVVYDSWWFEGLMVVLAVNFIGNIVRYRLLRKEKFNILLFHLAFVVILLGAAVTRYTGYEGLMHIREGQQSNTITSQERYFRLDAHMEDQQWNLQRSMKISQLKQPNIKTTIGTRDVPLHVEVTKFIPDAVQTMVTGNSGDKVVELVTVVAEGRKSFYLGERWESIHQWARIYV